MPTTAAAIYAQPGRPIELTTGFSEIEPKSAALVPSRTSPGLNRMMNRARSWFVSVPISPTMIGGMMNAAMIVAVA